MLTKKHYRAIASIIDNLFKYYNETLIYNQDEEILAINSALENLSNKLADYFAQDNMLFDRQKFLTACGLLVKI